MLLTLMLSAALAAQVPPAPPAPPAPPSPPAAAPHTPPPAPPAPPAPPEPPLGFVAPLNDAFARLDEDGDGRLSKEEFAGGDRNVHVITRSSRGPGVHRFQMRRDAEDAGRSFVIVAGDGATEVRTERRIEIRRGGD